LEILKSSIASAPLIGGEASSSIQDSSAEPEMFFFFDCELIFMINLVIGKGSAEAQEKLLRSQALHETECIQQPQEMMATNSNFT
jgi:hypothetical protein